MSVDTVLDVLGADEGGDSLVVGRDVGLVAVRAGADEGEGVLRLTVSRLYATNCQ